MRRRGRRRGRVVLLQEGRGLGAEDARDDRGESHGGVHGGHGRGRRVQARRVPARARRPDREERRRGRSSGSKEGRGRRVLGGQAARDRGGARARELHGGGGASRSCAKRRRLESRHASFGRRAGRSDAATPRTIAALGRLLFPRSIGYGLFFPVSLSLTRPSHSPLFRWTATWTRSRTACSTRRTTTCWAWTCPPRRTGARRLSSKRVRASGDASAAGPYPPLPAV